MQIFVFNLLEKKLRKLNVMKIQNQIFSGYMYVLIILHWICCLYVKKYELKISH